MLYLTGTLHSGKGYTEALLQRGRATKGNYTYLFYHNCQNVTCDYLIWILNGAFLVIEVFKITPVKTWKIWSVKNKWGRECAAGMGGGGGWGGYCMGLQKRMNYTDDTIRRQWCVRTSILRKTEREQNCIWIGSGEHFEDTTLCVHPDGRIRLDTKLCVHPDGKIRLDTTLCVHPDRRIRLATTLCVHPDRRIRLHTTLCVHPDRGIRLDTTLCVHPDRRIRLDTTLCTPWSENQTGRNTV